MPLSIGTARISQSPTRMGRWPTSSRSRVLSWCCRRRRRCDQVGEASRPRWPFRLGGRRANSPVRRIFLQAGLLGLLWWWGWPSTAWLGSLVVALAVIVLVENAGLIVIQFLSRRVVRRAMEEAPDRPLAVPHPRDDLFGRWWRTALQVPFHPARHAASSQRGLRAAAAPPTRHLATFDDADRRSGHLLPARGRVDLRRQARTGSPDAARVRAPWLDRRREQLPPRPARSLARADRRRDAGARVDQEEHRDLRRRPGSRRDRGRFGGRSPRVSLVALSADDPTWRPEDMADVKDWTVRGALSFYGVLEMTGRRGRTGADSGGASSAPPRAPRRPAALSTGNEELYRSHLTLRAHHAPSRPRSSSSKA